MLLYLLGTSIVFLLIPLVFSIISLVLFKYKTISAILVILFLFIEIAGVYTLYFEFIHDNSIPQQINIEQLEKIDFNAIDKNGLKKMFSDYEVGFDRGDSDINNDSGNKSSIMSLMEEIGGCSVVYYGSEAGAQTDFSLEKETIEEYEPELLIGHGNNCQYLITNINKSRDEWGVFLNLYSQVVIQSENVIVRIFSHADTEDEIIKINDAIINDILLRIQKQTRENDNLLNSIIFTMHLQDDFLGTTTK